MVNFGQFMEPWDLIRFDGLWNFISQLFCPSLISTTLLPAMSSVVETAVEALAARYAASAYGVTANMQCTKVFEQSLPDPTSNRENC